jgi:predicted ribosomally synthesized peptide with SipW-like signal peptide
MKKKILASIMVIGILALAMGYGTYSYFSSTKTSTSNTFTAGTLSINLGESETPEISIGNMAPGDVTGDWVITIKNDGNLPLAWFGNWIIEGNAKLKEALYIDYAKMEFLKLDGTSTWETTDNFITDGRGSGPYPDWFNTLADSSPFHVVTLAVWDGNNGMGTTPYEHAGALNPGYSYRLTVRFGFAAAADNTYQGAGPLTINLKVDATQVNAGAIGQLSINPSAIPGLVDWLNAQLAKQHS